MEGYTLKNGDVLLDPRDIDISDLMLNAIGLPPMEISKLKWTYGQQYELTQYFSTEQSRIRREYVEAFDDRNSAALNELRNEWRELQRQKGRVRPFFNNARGVLNNQPVSDLLKAPREQNRRERRMQQRFN
jgi:hypothetical protein